MKALNFYDVLEKENLIDLGLAFESEEKKIDILNKLAELFSKNKILLTLQNNEYSFAAISLSDSN